jgi:hypothetical protein
MLHYDKTPSSLRLHCPFDAFKVESAQLSVSANYSFVISSPNLVHC